MARFRFISKELFPIDVRDCEDWLHSHTTALNGCGQRQCLTGRSVRHSEMARKERLEPLWWYVDDRFYNCHRPPISCIVPFRHSMSRGQVLQNSCAMQISLSVVRAGICKHPSDHLPAAELPTTGVSPSRLTVVLKLLAWDRSLHAV